jgi:hypothetical protein
MVSLTGGNPVNSDVGRLSFMTKDTRDEALDKIQEIADVREGLRIIEAIARHRDISNVNPDHDVWLAKSKRANQ